MSGTEQRAPTPGDLRVWWIPQVPGKAFTVPVATPKEGAKLLAVLAAYDMFQLTNRIKPDYSNVGGLEVFDYGEWCDWEDDNGMSVESITVPDDGFVRREAEALAAFEAAR